MSKPRNPRRITLEILRNVARRVRDEQRVWTVDGRTYDLVSRDDGSTGAVWRERRPDEYPEAQRQNWVALEAAGLDLILAGERLQRHARNQMSALETEG